jgi:hypothetical protein
MKASRRIEIGSRALGRCLACVCLVAATSVAGSARAQSSSADSERANELFKKGKVAFNEAKYVDALRIYSEAWRLKQSPDIAANLAQTEAELGKHRDAAEHFAFALAHLLPSSTDEQKQALAEGLEVEKKEVGTLHVTLEPADAQLTIDDAQVSLPINGDLYVEAGDHRTSVTRAGYDANQQTLHVSKGASQVLWIRLREVGTKVPATAVADEPVASLVDTPQPKLDDEARRSALPAIVGGGLLIAGATVGVVFLLSGNSSQKDADQLTSGPLSAPNACGTGTAFSSDCSKLHADNKDIDRSRTIEGAGFAVAGAVAVGTALYLLWPHSSTSTANNLLWPHSSTSTANNLTPTFAIAPGAGSLGLAGRF